MKNLVYLFLLLSSISLAHSRFTLTDNVNGLQYQCGSTAPNPPSDSDCTPTLSEFCSNNTSATRNWCFSISSAYCQGKSINYKSCVKKIARYCIDNTSQTSSWCFEHALTSCEGQGLVTLLEAVRKTSFLKAKGIDLK